VSFKKLDNAGSCNFSTGQLVYAEHFNFAINLSKMGFDINFSFLDPNFLTRKFFWQPQIYASLQHCQNATGRVVHPHSRLYNVGLAISAFNTIWFLFRAIVNLANITLNMNAYTSTAANVSMNLYDFFVHLFVLCCIVPCRQPVLAPHPYYPAHDTVRLHWKVSTAELAKSILKITTRLLLI